MGMKERTFKGMKFGFRANSPYVRLVDDIFGTDIRSLLLLLAQNCDGQYGFNYELGSKVRQYYGNVHATVLFNLFASRLLNEKELRVLQDALFRLRDSNPYAVYEKTEEDRHAWDVIEGPSTFSTALACYGALLTRDTRVEEIGKSIKWLLEQRNDGGIWPIFKKGDPSNYVTTLYSALALRLWSRAHPKRQVDQEIDIAFQEVRETIENSFIRDGTYYFVPKYGGGEFCLSNTAASLYLLKILGSNEFSEVYEGCKKTIQEIVLEDEDWHTSLLGDVRRANRIKTMYTYNPAYLLVLIQLGWDVTDPVVLKMLLWIVSDLKNFWIRKGVIYPWRSSDSVIQSFVCGLSIQSVFAWVRKFLEANIGDIERNIDQLVLGKDTFLCHASEDKEAYVRRLNDELLRNGISVWYDEGEILWGDRITSKIEEGIRSSRFAIICLSDSFLKKNWPNAEFAALFHRQQAEGKKIILPLILNSKGKILERYPLIRDIQYEEWAKGVPYLVSQIKRILRR